MRKNRPSSHSNVVWPGLVMAGLLGPKNPGWNVAFYRGRNAEPTSGTGLGWPSPAGSLSNTAG